MEAVTRDCQTKTLIVLLIVMEDHEFPTLSQSLQILIEHKQQVVGELIVVSKYISGEEKLAKSLPIMGEVAWELCEYETALRKEQGLSDDEAVNITKPTAGYREADGGMHGDLAVPLTGTPLAVVFHFEGDIKPAGYFLKPLDQIVFD